MSRVYLRQIDLTISMVDSRGMSNVGCHLYSPFSAKSNFSIRERSLLLQFLLSSIDRGNTEELVEHISLLPFAFPGLPSEPLLKSAKNPKNKKKFFSLLVPFLESCREDESLILFLLRHRKQFEKHLAIETFIPPLDSLKKNWHKRGYPALAKELDELTKT